MQPDISREALSLVFDHGSEVPALLAHVLHQLGNPLQSVRSCIDLCREDASIAGATAEYLELASSELKRMAQILGQLRELCASERGEA